MPKITPIHWNKLIKVFKSDGWKIDRIKGDHIILNKEGYKRAIVIPRDNDIEVFIILNNLKTANIPRKEYFEILKKI